MPEFNDVVVPWADILVYLAEYRERVVADLTQAEDIKQIWQAQGKLTLLDELCNIKEVFATLASIEKG